MPGSRNTSDGYREAKQVTTHPGSSTATIITDCSSVVNLSLPSLITCQRCNKKKAHRNFAKKRQYDAKLNFSKGKGATAICMHCTGAPILELQCFVCDRWKSLDEYAKAQRKNSEHATCEKCMKDQVEAQPIEAGGTRGYDDDSDDEDGAHCYMPAPDVEEKGEGLSVDLIGLCIGENGKGNSAKNSEPAGSAVKNHGGQSAMGGTPLPFGFNPKAYSSRASSTVNSMVANPPASRNSNFAKVGAYKAPKPKKEQEKKDSDSENDWHGDQEDEEELDEDEI